MPQNEKSIVKLSPGVLIPLALPEIPAGEMTCHFNHEIVFFKPSNENAVAVEELMDQTSAMILSR